MALQIDGTTVGEARYARDDGSLATVGEARVWDDGRWKTVYESWRERTVTIRTTSTGWNISSDSGDTDLISSLASTGVTFEEDVVCDRTVRAGGSSVSQGDRIAAGQNIQPSAAAGTGVLHTFTSVR